MNNVKLARRLSAWWLAALLLGWGALATPAQAAPASQASIEELLVVTRAESLVNAVYGQMEDLLRRSMTEMIKGQTLDTRQQALVQAMPTQMAKTLREELSWGTLKPLYLQIYGESFTQDEVDGLIAFYKSTAGQALVNKMPVVMQKSMMVMQQRMAPLAAKMQAATRQAFADAGLAVPD